MYWVSAESRVALLSSIISFSLNSYVTDKETWCQPESGNVDTWKQVPLPPIYLQERRDIKFLSSKKLMIARCDCNNVPQFYKQVRREINGKMHTDTGEKATLRIWRKDNHFCTKGTIHHDLLPTCHPDWGGTWGQGVEGPRQFSQKTRLQRAPTMWQELCWAWVLSVAPAPRKTHHWSTRPAVRVPEVQAPSSHTSSHRSWLRGTSQDLWTDLRHFSELNNKILSWLVKKNVFSLFFLLFSDFDIIFYF